MAEQNQSISLSVGEKLDLLLHRQFHYAFEEVDHNKQMELDLATIKSAISEMRDEIRMLRGNLEKFDAFFADILNEIQSREE